LLIRIRRAGEGNPSMTLVKPPVLKSRPHQKGDMRRISLLLRRKGRGDRSRSAGFGAHAHKPAENSHRPLDGRNVSLGVRLLSKGDRLSLADGSRYPSQLTTAIGGGKLVIYKSDRRKRGKAQQ